MFKVNKKKTPEWRQWRRSGVFIVNFEQISNLFPVFLLSTLNKSILVGKPLILNKLSTISFFIQKTSFE